MRSKFYLFDPKAKNASAVFAWVSHNGKRIRIPTGLSIDPACWNPEKHRAIIKNDKEDVALRKKDPGKKYLIEAPEFNLRLQEIATAINKTYLKYKSDNDEEPEPEELKILINHTLGRNIKKPLDFIQYFEDFIYRQKEGLRVNAKGGIVNPDDAKHYQHTLNSIKAFRPKTDFKDISLSFYNDYLQHLNKSKMSINTVGSHIKRLKAVLNEAKAAGYKVNPDFESKYFSKQAETADNIALTIKELEALQNLNLSGETRLEAVRDLFVIGCYTGLRYSDFSRLTASNIKDGFITITQQKTGNPVVIPVHPVVAAIIDRYGGVLPAGISNQKTNEYLKEITKKVKLLEAKESKTTTKGGKKVTLIKRRAELISTHTARRTFATIQYNKGVPSITIMAITGHRTERDFLKYIKVNPTEHAQKIKELWADEARDIVKVV